jgi:hypothetical protein
VDTDYRETDEPFLQINELPNDASKHTHYFQGLGFSDNELCLLFCDVISKIQEHTAGRLKDSRTYCREDRKPNHSRELPQLFTSIALLFPFDTFLLQFPTVQRQGFIFFEENLLFKPS